MTIFQIVYAVLAFLTAGICLIVVVGETINPAHNEEHKVAHIVGVVAGGLGMLALTQFWSMIT